MKQFLSLPTRLTTRLLFYLLFSLLLLSSANSQVQCNTWLFIGGDRSGADIGIMQIGGTELTVECLFNRTQSWDPIAQGGDLISNHCSPDHINYLLRPNSAQIRTTNGFFTATDNGPISLNTTYHVAMVYNGSTLSLYRNGNLVAQTAVTGQLMQSNFTTRVGRTSCLEATWPTDFIGYINEVRIWDIARTQTQIQSAMNLVLANPQTQPGLQSYLTFNSLNNKVNPTFPNYYSTATLFGSQANINAVNPNLGLFAICDVPNPGAPSAIVNADCNTYLRVTAANTGVQVGNINVTGNQLTVEAIINRTQPIAPGYAGGDIVSKHCDPTDASYFLRPDQAGIRTTNGLFVTPPPPCTIQLNQTYHVAMVYNGSVLRLYRNGEMISSVTATGNLMSNSWQTMIGKDACPSSNPEEFLGYINEVRIWNTARRTQELDKYRFKKLNQPTDQPNLLAYYEFNSLNNLQGNAAFNGTVSGSPAPVINQTNPQCSIIGGHCFCPLCRTAEVPATHQTVKKEQQNEKISDDKILTEIQPNPTKDYITIFSENSKNKYWILTSNGNIIKQLQMAKGSNRVYVGDLPNGLYFLKVTNGQNTATEKFIKL